MSVDPEILRLQESVPCIGCPLVKICEEYDKTFADRGMVDIYNAASAGDPMPLLQFELDAIEPGFDIETGSEISGAAIEAMRRGNSEQVPNSAVRSVIRHKFLTKRLVPRDVGNAYELLKDRTAQIYTFGCESPYKRFKLFGKLGCGGMVLPEPAATQRYELRARMLNELADES